MVTPLDTSVGSCSSGFAVTPSDATVFPGALRGIYVGGVGDVAVRLLRGDGTTLVFKGVPVGTLLPVAVDKILATGTTATFLIGLGS